jgi:hypothetical protein
MQARLVNTGTAINSDRFRVQPAQQIAGRRLNGE